MSFVQNEQQTDSARMIAGWLSLFAVRAVGALTIAPHAP